jgi:hypothetical protein
MKSFTSGYIRLSRIRKQQKLQAQWNLTRAAEQVRMARQSVESTRARIEAQTQELKEAMQQPEVLHSLPSLTLSFRRLSSQLDVEQQDLSQKEQEQARTLLQLKSISEKEQLVETLLKKSMDEHRAAQRYAEEKELFQLSQSYLGMEARR